MSRSPQDSRTKGDVKGYSDAWQAIIKLVREGHSWSGHERNCAFLNCQGQVGKSKGLKVEGSFAGISAVSGLDFADDGRAVALTDWDNDGDLDIWLHNRSGPRLRLMINQSRAPSYALRATEGKQGSEKATGDVPAFVALRLRGTTCNRDAIGARVEVVPGDSPRGPNARRPTRLIQTLRAGDGFLSQSSKWLHFGLGAVTRIAAVRVRWPGAATESFSGLRPGRRYVLEQGRGAAVEWTRPPADGGLRLEASTQKSHKKTSSAQVLLPDRVALPILRYSMFDGSARRIEPRDGPVLVNFWASWCLPCVAELKGLKANEKKLRGAGLTIIALCVDGLEQDGPTDQADAQRLLEQIEFPFVSAAATAELMDKVDLMVGFLFDRHPALAVPTSLLIDGQGRLAAIYRGPVEAERLLRDLAALQLPAADLRRLATPLSGRRHQPLMARRLDELAARFIDRYEEDHLRFLRLAADEADTIVGQIDAAQLPEARRQELANARFEAHYKLAAALNDRGRLDEAISQYRVAIRVRPDFADTCYILASLLQRRGDIEAAMAQYRSALAIDSNKARAHYNLANGLLAAGRNDEAVRHYGLTLKIDAAHLLAHNNMALALASLGRVGEAVAHFREAIRIDPQDLSAHYNLAATLQARGRFAEAVVHYRRALAIAPDHPSVLNSLGVALAAQGKFKEARVHLTRALQLATAAGNEATARALRAQLDKLNP